METSRPSSSSGQTILYVRHRGAHSIAVDTLASAGYSVHFVDEPDIAQALANGEMPALVLVEYSTDTQSLIRSIAAMRQPNASWAPVVACCPDRADVQSAITAGADDFLVLSDTHTLASRLTVLLRQKARSDQLDGILDCTFDGIITIDERGRILSFNKAARVMFGFEPSEVLGKNVSVLMPEPDKSQHDDHLRRYVATGEERIVGTGRAVTGQRKGGDRFPLFLQVTNIRRGRDHVFVGTLKDLSVEAQAQSLKFEVMHDAMTGIANRRQIYSVLDRWTDAQHNGPGKGFAVIFIDLDHFKNVNDTHGHDAGDALLKAVSGRLSHGVSSEDIVGRLAGDEFIVLLANIERRSDAEAVARRLLERIAEPVPYGSVQLHVSGSAGVAVFPLDARTPAELLGSADAAMFRAKGANKNSRRRA